MASCSKKGLFNDEIGQKQFLFNQFNNSILFEIIKEKGRQIAHQQRMNFK